jgi:hypothetical protein
MPTFAQLVALVSDFASDYTVLIAAGAAVSLIAYGVKRLIKAGR